MNERIQRNGQTKKINNGTTTTVLVGYDVYDASMRFVIGSVFGVPEAESVLERDVRMSKIACGSGACED
jgi:hypothetical protein